MCSYFCTPVFLVAHFSLSPFSVVRYSWFSPCALSFRFACVSFLSFIYIHIYIRVAAAVSPSSGFLILFPKHSHTHTHARCCCCCNFLRYFSSPSFVVFLPLRTTHAHTHRREGQWWRWTFNRKSKANAHTSLSNRKPYDCTSFQLCTFMYICIYEIKKLNYTLNYFSHILGVFWNIFKCVLKFSLKKLSISHLIFAHTL